MSKLPSVIGRFQVLRRLGQGGMAYLFLAWDPMLERQVAIKRLRDDNDELRERFTREARSVARLRHPNIVTIYDVGEQDGEPFIAMEYVVGQTMAEVIQAALPLPITRTLEIISELCDGLGFAHKAGIVHRDVKPANIIVEPEGSIKILDFGIARIAESGMTQAGMLIGTLNYMSPEQVAGLVVDSRSDIFAVGAVFYELLTYRQAFPGGLHNGILNKILSEEPLSLAIACPGLDPEVIRVVERALHKEPEARFQDLASMRKEIARIQQRLESLPPEALAAVSPPPLNENATTKPPGISHALSTSEREDNQRQKDIVEHLDQAYSALARHDFDAALAAARQALQLNPHLREAAEIQERIRLGQETHQVEQWLAAAQELLVAGSLTDAQALADQALTVAPGLPAAVKLREAIDAARREAEQNRRRAEALKTALARAESLLASGPLDDAAKAAAEALSLAPEAPDARALQRRIQHAIAEREALEGRVDQVLRNADSAAAAGRFGDAIAALREFRPEHSRVTAALAQVSEAERLHRDREAVRLREESIATALAAAEPLSSHEEAIARLRDAQELDPNNALVRDAIAARERAAAREQEEARLAQERQRLVDAAIARAKKTSAHDAAIDILEDARRIDPGRDDVRLAMEQRESALAHQREQERLAREREERIAGAVAKAQRAGSHEAAIGILHEALKRDSEQAELQQALKEREALLAQQREQERLAREREERIAGAVAKAQRAGSHEAAIGILHEALKRDSEQAELQQALKEREALLAQQREQERLARERQERIAGAVAKAQRAGSHEAAIGILHEALKRDSEQAELQQALKEREALLAQQREQERLAREREERIAGAVAKAQRAGSHEAAIGILHEALKRDSEQAELQQALKEREALLAQQREQERLARERQERIAGAVAKAQRAGPHEAAIGILHEALKRDSEQAELRQALKEREALLAQQREQERLARERQERIAGAVAKAQRAGSHEAAIGILHEALKRDSEQAELQQALKEREALLAQQREQERLARERQERIAGAVAKAQRTESHEAAIGILHEALKRDSEQAELRQALKEREALLAHQREQERLARERQERIAGAVAKAQRTESHEAAIGILHEALKRDSEQAELRQALKEREALLAHQREQERLARERQERIAAIIANAKGLASHEAALALLRDAQRIDPNHPELRLVVEQREAGLSREQEEARRIRERENKIAGVIAKAERTGHHEAAIAILNEAVALDPDNAEAKRLIEVRRAAMAEEQRQARERAEKIAIAIARAHKTASHETAIATLQRAKELDPQHRELRQALEARHAALQAERAEKRRIEEQRQVIAAGLAKARQTTSNQAALAILQELARLDPDHAEIRDLMQARLTALEQEQEAAHQARLRQEQITALVAEAKASRSHADAVAALTRALDLDPSDQRVRALLETRTAAAERERAAAARQQSIQDARARIGELIEKRNFDSAQSALDDAERTHEAKREMKEVRRALARERKAAAGPQPVSSRQGWTRLGIAAAVVLSVGLGYWALRTPGPAPTPLERGADTQATSPAAPSPGPAETARPDPNTPVPPAASDVPIAGGPAPEAPVVESPEIPPVVPETIQRARQQMAQGNLPQAAVIVMEGLKTQASDRQLRALAVEIVADARAQALKARGAADERGDVAMNTPPYRDASRRIVDAGRLERAGRYDQATRSLSEAQGLFSRAAQAAQPPQVAQTPRPTSPPELVPVDPPSTAVPPSTVTQSPALPPPAAAPPTTATAPPTVPTSQPPPAATTPTLSAAAQAAADEEGVRSALRAYEQAYSSLKVEAVLEVYPDVNAAQLKRSFDDLREQQVSIACDQIAVSGVNANATCQVRTSILPRAGSRRTQMIRSLFRLQKVGNRWIIVERRGA